MYTYSPVMDYNEAVPFLAERILREQSENPYLVFSQRCTTIWEKPFLQKCDGCDQLQKKG